MNADRTESMVETSPSSFPAIIIGSLLGFDEAQKPLVDFAENAEGRPLPALTCVPLGPELAGSEVALAYVNGDKQQPIILGIVRRRPMEATRVPESSVEVTLSAEKELVLQCGKASITLTRAGKILIRGQYIVSQSSGVNQIEGASVEIN